jgi:hypothetical protein
MKLYKKVQKAINDYNSYDATSNSFKNTTRFQPGTGFIPFNLSLTIDGLSGVKIGSKFLVDGSYLPSNYPNTVDFLIKNITHEIKDNKWTTNLESYCIAQGDSSYTTPKRESTSKETIKKEKPEGNPDRDKNTNTKNRGDFFSWVRGPYAAPDEYFSNSGYVIAVLKGTVKDKFTQKASTNPPTLKTGYPKTVNSSRGTSITTEKYITVDYTSTEYEKQLKDILTGIGATSTPGNIVFMKAWRQAEGGSALNNPWNSTQSIGTKKSNYNYVGVKNYFNYNDGVTATVKTMTNGRYNTVVKALKKGLKDKNEALELARLVQKYDMTGAIPAKWQ